MLTLVFRPLEVQTPTTLDLDQLAQDTAEIFSDLIQAQVITTVTGVLGPNGAEMARHIRWHTHGTRDRLVLETTWHLTEWVVVIDAIRAAVNFHCFTAVWTVCRQAAQAGYTWAAAWWDHSTDQVLDNLWFRDAQELFNLEDGIGPMPTFGRRDLGENRVVEWLHPSVRIMSRLVYFAEDCKIEWESLIIKDLMTQTEATYLELREGRKTVALARVLRETFLPGMEGYDPRSPRRPVQFDIESLEVHPDYKSKGYGSILVGEVQRLCRPISTLDTYRRAEKFWRRIGFVYNARRSAREDSNIFEWLPRLGPQVKSMTADDE